jgi:ribosome-binding protein aMBF1 (putative translation factor)
MEFITFEEAKNRTLGKVGTPRRDAYEEEVRKALVDYRIGEAIKAERKRQGLTQEQLGERMGVQKAQVSKIENGRGISYSSLVKAFKALGAKAASLDLGDMGKVALW